MDISLRQLEAFIKVAEHRSFSKAGDELFLSQSTISSHVAQLEQSLQVTLIKRREKKNIELTEEGKRAYRAAQIIINQAEMLTKACSARRRPTSPSYPLPPLRCLRATYCRA